MQLDTNILVHAIPAFLLLSALETIYIIKETGFSFKGKELLTDLSLAVGFILISPLTKSLQLLVYSFAYEHRVFNMPSSAAWTLFLCFLGEDFTYYWFHRVSHQVRFMWAAHMVHHSSETYTLSSAAFRLSWTNNFTGGFLFWMWMPLIGFTPSMILFTKSANTIYQFLLHTERVHKLPKWFEAIFNTPSHHRVHHGSNVEYLDKNHGGTLIIWDRLFGTYQEEICKPVYGLTKKINSRNPIVISFFEWKNIYTDLKKAKTMSDYINFLVNSPGWSNEGTSKTTKQLRKNITSEKYYDGTVL